MVVVVVVILFQAPYVFKNEVLLVSKGDAGTITNHLLDVQDRDNPQDVTVIILDPPKHGQLVKLSGNGPLTLRVFSLGELSGGFVHYIHDGSNSLEDTAVLQVSDGYHFQNILFRIKIDLKVRPLKLCQQCLLIIWCPTALRG